MRRRRGDRPLSRAEIVDAALAIADEDGLAALTMRRLGAALNVEAMSLYAHVGNKDELLDHLADRVMAEVTVRSGADPVEAAMELARGYRATLLRHPNLLPVLARRRTGPPDPGPTKRNAAMAFARDAGLDQEFAVIAYMTIVSFVAGHVMTHAGLLGAGADGMEGPDSDRLFEEGLAATVEGLLSRAGRVARIGSDAREFGLCE